MSSVQRFEQLKGQPPNKRNSITLRKACLSMPFCVSEAHQLIVNQATPVCSLHPSQAAKPSRSFAVLQTPSRSRHCNTSTQCTHFCTLTRIREAFCGSQIPQLRRLQRLLSCLPRAMLTGLKAAMQQNVPATVSVV